MIKHSNK